MTVPTTLPTTTVAPRRFSRGAVAALVAAGVGLAGVCGVGGAVVASDHAGASPAVAQAPTAATTTTTTGVPARHASGAPVTPTRHVVPSASVRLLQQQLGDLNYYDGSIDGIEGRQTIDAIRYLQRDAHLPQTGRMDHATIDVLDTMLATGNNTMAG